MKITPLLVSTSALLALVGAINVSHAQTEFNPNPTLTPTPTKNDRFDSRTNQSESFDSGSTLDDDMNSDTVGESRFTDDRAIGTDNRDSLATDRSFRSEDRLARADRN